MIDLSITIVNYNTKDLLRQCIKSIFENTKDISYEIIVVDNASIDGSVEMLQTEFVGIKVIQNKENLFFTRAHNQALRISNGRYLMILNSDTIILENTFDKMVRFMDEHSEAGACGPKLLNADFSLQKSVAQFPTFPNNYIKKQRFYFDLELNKTIEVDSVGGSCIILKREVVEKVGLLDEKFLAYWEEIDWCKRIVDAGYKVYYFPEAQLVHFWQVTMSKLGKEKKEKIFYNSMVYYYKKHYGIITSSIFFLLLIFFRIPFLKTIRFLKKIIYKIKLYDKMSSV